jgi:glycerol kinase
VESVPYQIKDVIVAMEADSGTPLTELKIDGGITSNRFVVQFLADLLDRIVTNIELTDVSALGAGYLAGLNAKIYRDIDHLKTFNQNSTSTLTGADFAKVKVYYEGWKNAIQKN